MSRVLVTGGLGFIGRNALVPPHDRGYAVHASGWREADLLEPGTAARLIEELRPTHTLHFAWDARPGKWTSTENVQWIDRSLRLLRALPEGGGSRAVLAGTCAEYERSDEVHCVEGATPLAPATPYGAAKHGLSEIAGRYAEQASVSLTWGRIFRVNGPHEQPGRLASSVASALIRGEPAETSAGTRLRAFMHSEDLGDAFAALLDSEVQDALNMASREPRPIRDLAVARAEAAGRPDLMRIGARASSPSEPASITAAVERLRDEVGWRGGRTLEQGAADTIACCCRAVPAL